MWGDGPYLFVGYGPALGLEGFDRDAPRGLLVVPSSPSGVSGRAPLQRKVRAADPHQPKWRLVSEESSGSSKPTVISRAGTSNHWFGTLADRAWAASFSKSGRCVCGGGERPVALQHHVQQRLQMHELVLEADPDGPANVAGDTAGAVGVQALQPIPDPHLVGEDVVEWGHSSGISEWAWQSAGLSTSGSMPRSKMAE